MNRITRSDTDAMLFGVCGGISEAYGVDANLLRAGFVLLGFAWGLGLVVYLLLAFFLPAVDGSTGLQADWSGIWPRLQTHRRSLGIILVAVGVVLFIFKLGLFQWLTWERVWPVLLILAGLALLRRPS
jgi:phage shock protein C